MSDHRTPSYWEAQHWFAPVDVAIVGGGIVGLQTALYLHDVQPNLQIAVIDADDPPGGASTRNAGFACIGSLGELADDIRTIGFEPTLQLVLRRAKGLELLRERLGDQQIRYEHCGNIEWFREHAVEQFEEALDLIQPVNTALQVLGKPFQLEESFRQNTSLPAIAAIRNRAEGQLDSGAMMRGLQNMLRKAEIRLLTSQVDEIQGELSTGFELRLQNSATLKAAQVVLAVNGFASDFDPSPLPETIHKIQPAFNQVIVSRPVQGLTWELPMHVERGYGYMRRIGDRVLVGGFRNRFSHLAQDHSLIPDPELGQYLRDILQQLLPKGQSAQVEYEWKGRLGIGPTRNPEVQRDSLGMVRAVGLGGMGVALGSLLAMEAAHMVLGEKAIS